MEALDHHIKEAEESAVDLDLITALVEAVEEAAHQTTIAYAVRMVIIMNGMMGVLVVVIPRCRRLCWAIEAPVLAVPLIIVRSTPPRRRLLNFQVLVPHSLIENPHLQT